MGKRIMFEDAVNLALIYINKATGRNMISYDKASEFDRVINNNLDNMNSSVSFSYDNESKLYFPATDENGRTYLVIDPNVDIKTIKRCTIGSLPTDVLVASQKKNALNVIGLKLVNGVIVKDQENNHTIDQIIEKVLDNPKDFFIKISNSLSIEEREYLKLLIKNKSCNNCSNESCRVESIEKTCDDACVSWENKELIGRQKVLS